MTHRIIDWCVNHPVIPIALLCLAVALSGCGPASSTGQAPTPFLIDVRGDADPQTVTDLHEAVRGCYELVSRLDPQPWFPVDLVIHETYWDLRASRDLRAPTFHDEVITYHVWRVRGSRPTVHVTRGYKNVPVGLAHGMWHARRRHGNSPDHVGFAAIEAAWQAQMLDYWITRSL